MMKGSQIEMTESHPMAATGRTARAGTASLLAAVVATLAFVAVLACGAPPARAAFGIQDGLAGFDGGVFNADQTAATQAGAHPHEARTRFLLTGITNAGGTTVPEEALRDVRVELPAGFVGNPTATPKCSMAQLMRNPIFGGSVTCPPESAVGATRVLQADGNPLPVFPYGPEIPVYNMVPPPGSPAMFAFNTVTGPVVTMIARVRSDGDYGVSVEVRNNSQTLPVGGAEVVFWGAPADPVHDGQRAECFRPIYSFFFPDACPMASRAPETPFLTNPTSCTGPVRTHLHVESWAGSTDSAFFDSHLPDDPTTLEDESQTLVGTSGCDLLEFDPSVSARPTAARADGPTGFEFELQLPQDANPDGLATAHLKRAEVTLPEGMTINPASADGLAACDDADLALGSTEPESCPAASRIGSVEVETPLLEETLSGAVYVRSQTSSDPASGEMFRLAIVVGNERRGIRIKLPGSVHADPATGRLVTVFDDNPQLPFSSLSLRLKGGPRAPLATPPTCGTKAVRSELTSWAQPDVPVVRTDSFTIPCPGQAGFAPAFGAGAVSPTGGAFSPFVARIERPEGQRFLSGVALDLPQGVIAKLRGVTLCPDAVAGDGTPGACPAASRIGTATVGAGAGTPFHLKGDVYLTGPYRGGPYGLSVQVHAKAGPFDLGLVKVRQAIHVDPETAELSIVSDALPQVVKGVPVRLRSVDVVVDRPGFTINPTSCAEKRIEATLTSIGGAVHETGSRFQVGDCRSLAFRPRLAMRLTGRKQRRTGGHPGLRVSLTQDAGQANLDALVVKLPRSLALDPDNAQGLCSFEESRKPDPRCPASSVVGRATAYTPVLNKPLTGPVYFAENKRVNSFGRLVSTLPSFVIALRGEVAINVRQGSAVKGGRLISTTPVIPDAPVSRFDLRLKGGAGGIVTVTRSASRRFDVCRGRHIALVESDGQNGRRADFRVRVKRPCRRR